MKELIEKLNSQFEDYLITIDKNLISVYNGSKAFDEYCIESFTFDTKSLVSDLIMRVRHIIRTDVGVAEFAKRFNLK